MIPPLFLFGPLCHPQLFQAVVGDTRHLRQEEAVLPGFSVKSAAGGGTAVISADSEGETTGLIVSGLSEADYAALDFYEAIFGHSSHPVVLADGRSARAYLPPQGRRQGVVPWDLAVWAREWGEISVRAARETMSYRGSKSPQQLANMMPTIQARAASSINAEHSRHGAGTLNGDVEIIERSRPYANFFALEEFDLRHRRFDGDMSPTLSRAVFRPSDATLVLPYDVRRDRVLLVEQFRAGPMARGDAKPWQLEAVAGRIDAGETPETAARREALEETGVEIGRMHTVGEVYCSPGNSSEFYYMFVGEADLPDEAARLGGLASEDEDIRSHLLSFDTLMDMNDRFEIANAPLMILAFWLARHGTELRANAGL